MAHDQLKLDFSVTETAHEKPSPQSATVHDLGAARTLRHQVELGSVYQGIFDSVKHVRLNRNALSGVETPPTK